MVQQLREVRGLGVVTGMRLPDGSLWGSYRTEARDEVLVPMPDCCNAETVWRGGSADVKAPSYKDWDKRRKKWSWE